jgi:hypothetical protein
MDWIAGNSLYKSSPYTRQQQQSTMHAVNIYNTTKYRMHEKDIFVIYKMYVFL